MTTIVKGRDIMNIHLVGGSFTNKGDQLMRYAILDHYKGTSKELNFMVDLGSNYHKNLREVGIYYSRIIPPKVKISKSYLVYKVLQKYKNILGLKSDEEIDAVFDFSGFAYGDQWGPERTIFMSKQYQQWKKQGIKIILFPQAFGPFENSSIKKPFKSIVECADIVFAREKISYDHIINLCGISSHIKIAPDFTTLIKSAKPSNNSFNSNFACIVPNEKMISYTSSEVGDKYIPFVSTMIMNIRDRGLQPVLLLHEAYRDLKLIELIREKIKGYDLKVVVEKDPIVIKGILGKATIVIGSRYHSLVGALSQNIPCLGTGWSHKYQTLFEDYGCTECLISILDDQDLLNKKLDYIMQEPTRSSLIRKLEAESARQIAKTINMWNDIDSQLGLQSTLSNL